MANRQREGECDVEEEVASSLEEAESTLSECKSSLVIFERRERFLGERIERYRALMGRREGVIRKLEMESLLPPPLPLNQASGNNDDYDDLEGAKSENIGARIHRLDALRARHEVDAANLRVVVELHRGIIAEVETLRRRMDALITRRDDVVMKLEENRDFLIDFAAAAGHDINEEERGDWRPAIYYR
ncbi:hypothetical protein ACHAXA_011906 [Cyclostephanos tholiformis]|jgi:hypothetical protein|uniref:Uncharacterized protein n=1 Tax=Cyclostephanos tholiformis TaxID=382380 RepID=A0ABD3SC75_9STRA